MQTSKRFRCVAGFLSIAAVATQGATLWTNGSINASLSADNKCDFTGCGSASPWTIFDNFNAPVAWSVTGFDITDFFVNTPTSEYVSTSWALWSGDPLSGGTLVANGTTAGTLSNVSGTCGLSSTCLEQISINIPSQLLSSGVTYYLATSNDSLGGGTTLRAFASGGNTAPGGALNGLARWEQSNGSISGSSWSPGTSFTFPGGSIIETATAFDVQGTIASATPEPSTLSLSCIALAARFIYGATKVYRQTRGKTKAA